MNHLVEKNVGPPAIMARILHSSIDLQLTTTGCKQSRTLSMITILFSQATINIQFNSLTYHFNFIHYQNATSSWHLQALFLEFCHLLLVLMGLMSNWSFIDACFFISEKILYSENDYLLLQYCKMVLTV
jgi:hypothetical protein